MIAHRQPDLHQIYDQPSYRDEKRCGFELWAARLLEIVKRSSVDANAEVSKPPTPDDVASMRPGSRRLRRSSPAEAAGPDRRAAMETTR
jgi:hypothetical protein